MKKRAILVLTLLLAILSVSSVNAKINLQGPSQTKVNLGEGLHMTGYVLQTDDMFGLFKFSLNCDQERIVLVKAMSLKANVQKNFDETVSMNEYLEGTCTIRAFLEVNGKEVDAAQSSPFTLSRELLGTFSIDKTSVQLGETITINGEVTKVDGTKIDGSATVTFQKNKVIYLQEIVPVKKGKFFYTYNTQDNPAGTYEVIIEVADAYNNEQQFIVEDFTIFSDITLTAAMQQETFLPGEKIKLSGTAKAGENDLEDGIIYVMFNNEEFKTKVGSFLGGENFKLTIPIAKTIKSGSHTISLTAEDAVGNRKTGELMLTITPIPTTLELATNFDALQPREKLMIKPTLLDQGSDVIATPIAVTIRDAEKDILYQEELESNTQTELTLPLFAVPGNWKITATALGITTEKTITIVEVSNLEAVIEGTLLRIKNIGNIPFKDTLAISLTTANEENNREITKKIALDPDEEATMELAIETAPGTYTVTVEGKTFENVTITATKKKPLPWKSIGIPFLITIIIVYGLLKIKRNPGTAKRGRHLYQRRQKRRKPQLTTHRVKQHSEQHHVEKFKQDMYERLEKKRKLPRFKLIKRKDDFIMELPEKKQTSTMPKKRDTHSSYDEAKENYPVLGEVKERTEAATTDPFQEKEEESGEKKKGLFNMFD